MVSQETRDKTIAMRNGEIQMKKEGNYWTENERGCVRVMFAAGVPVNEIALELERSENAVYQQILQMGLYMRNPKKTRKRKSGRNDIGCLCNICSCDRSLCPVCNAYAASQEVT